MHRKLRVFISSTADLIEWREAIVDSLADLEIDGSKFEDWPSSNNDPITECLFQIDETEAFILILGAKYGSITESGISATHLEFKHALEKDLPIFVYKLNVEKREPKQITFVREVEKSKFRCKKIENLHQIKEAVRNSFVSEFAKCFRRVHFSKQKEKIPIYLSEEPITDDFIKDPQKTLAELRSLYDSQDDMRIYHYSAQCEELYSDNPEIMNIIYMAESNLVMNGYLIPSERIEKAVEFWESKSAKERWIGYSLLYNQANALSALGKHQEAIHKYKQSLSEESTQACCWKNLGGEYLKIGNLEMAKEHLEKALEINPQLFEALLSLARIKIENENKPEEGLNILNKIPISKASPHLLHSYYSWKAFVYLKLGDFPSGIANAENAINIDDNETWIWGVAGELYCLVRREKNAWVDHSIHFWDRFVTKFPNDPRAWAELGYIYFQAKERNTELNEKALFAFFKAIELGYFDDGLVFDRIGHIYQDCNNWESAEHYYKKAVDLNAELFSYCYGVSLIFLGKYSQALPFVIDAATKYNPDAMSWFQVALCHEKLGNTKKAEIYYKKAIKLDQFYEQAWFNLGGLYWNKSKFDKAYPIWSEAISRFPNSELAIQADNCMQGIDFKNVNKKQSPKPRIFHLLKKIFTSKNH